MRSELRASLAFLPPQFFSFPPLIMNRSSLSPPTLSVPSASYVEVAVVQAAEGLGDIRRFRLAPLPSIKGLEAGGWVSEMSYNEPQYQICQPMGELLSPSDPHSLDEIQEQMLANDEDKPLAPKVCARTDRAAILSSGRCFYASALCELVLSNGDHSLL